jgi:hypothetical protein
LASKRNLPDAVLTISPPGGFARRLNRRQQQRDKNANDGYHYK